MIINTEEDLARAQEYLKNSNIEEILKKTDTQDVPAICNYSGLRPVEGYKEEEIDKEILRVIIADLDTEEGKEKAECFRRGWLAGYDKGLYDGQYK